MKLKNGSVEKATLKLLENACFLLPSPMYQHQVCSDIVQYGIGPATASHPQSPNGTNSHEIISACSDRLFRTMLHPN